MRSDPDTGDNWFGDFKAGNEKYIVFKDRILKYRIGNQTEKENVCNPNLPQLLYIGFKLIPQIPYKIGV